MFVTDFSDDDTNDIIENDTNTIIEENIEELIHRFIRDHKRNAIKQMIEDCDEIIIDCIKAINDFYINYDDYDDNDNSIDSKVYFRLFPETGHWYIGSTKKYSAIDRHYEDFSRAKRSIANSKIMKFYRENLNTSLQVRVVIIATHTYLNSTRYLESKLIDYFTNRYNYRTNRTNLPIDLCLNSDQSLKNPKICMKK